MSDAHRIIEQPEGGFFYTFAASHGAVAEISAGETVTVLTVDAFEDRLRSEGDRYSRDCPGFPRVNPLTGPIAVRGAERGDVLAVTIDEVEPARDFAVTAIIPGAGALASTGRTAMLHDPLPEETRILPLEDGAVVFSNGLRIPVRTFVGTMGVAPELEATTSLTAGSHGGNMDCADVCGGTTVWFPVRCEGANFFIGDAHAAQGDGEITGVAAEIPARITLRFDVIKRREIAWPRLVTDEFIGAVGAGRPLEDAARAAHVELVRWIESATDLSLIDAYHLLGLAGEMRVSNLCNPDYTVAAKIRRMLLPGDVSL